MNNFRNFQKIIRFPIRVKYKRYDNIKSKYCTNLAQASYVPGEPAGPSIKTEVPGPKTKELKGELNKIMVIAQFYIVLK